MSELDWRRIEPLIEAALREDVGDGDVTTEALVAASVRAHGRIVARQAGVIAGAPAAERVFRRLADDARWQSLREEGGAVVVDDIVAEVSGPARALLTGERVALNFLQRLSGIATLTRRCVDAAAGAARILDTRKTTPGMRPLEKYAVRMGGGMNHREGLFDQVLIKDNHIRILGGIAPAVQAVRAAYGTRLIVEVEAETLEQARQAVAAGADIVLLDNMSLDDMRRAVEMVKRRRGAGQRPWTEASGGISPEKIAAVAATGVDRISLGALTHSAPVLDLAMDIWVDA